MNEIELDDEIEIIYNFKPNTAFVLLLTFAKEFIRPPHNFINNYDTRSKPYLQKK